jgi:hypothetical protein
MAFGEAHKTFEEKFMEIFDTLSTSGLTPEQLSELSAAYSHSQSAHLQFSGLTKISVSTSAPVNPSIGDIWIQI